MNHLLFGFNVILKKKFQLGLMLFSILFLFCFIYFGFTGVLFQFKSSFPQITLIYWIFSGIFVAILSLYLIFSKFMQTRPSLGILFEGIVASISCIVLFIVTFIYMAETKTPFSSIHTVVIFLGLGGTILFTIKRQCFLTKVNQKQLSIRYFVSMWVPMIATTPIFCACFINGLKFYNAALSHLTYSVSLICLVIAFIWLIVSCMFFQLYHIAHKFQFDMLVAN